MNRQAISPSYGNTWKRFDAVEQRLSAPLTQRMLDLGSLSNGMRVLDLATGRGEPAIPAATRVHPDGMVLGVDIDHSVLQIARERAECEGITNLTLTVSDAQLLDTVSSSAFDVAFCRWGLMYFQNPVQSLLGVRRSLMAGGSMVIAVWTDPDQATFHIAPRLALSNLAPVPLTVPGSPGPFYYADPDRLSKDLASAGFDVRHSELLHVDVMEATSNAELIDWCRSIGIPRLLQDVPTDVQVLWERELLRAVEPFRRSDGSVRLGGNSLVVVAA